MKDLLDATYELIFFYFQPNDHSRNVLVFLVLFFLLVVRFILFSPVYVPASFVLYEKAVLIKFILFVTFLSFIVVFLLLYERFSKMHARATHNHVDDTQWLSHAWL